MSSETSKISRTHKRNNSNLDKKKFEDKHDDVGSSAKKYLQEEIEGSQYRKKKRGNDLKDVRSGGRFAKNEFIERRSLLD